MVVFLQRTLKDKLLIFLLNTLLLHNPLLALTDGQNDRQRNELILIGLGNLRFLQVKVLFNSTSNSSSDSAETSVKNMIFVEVSALLEVLFKVLFFPSSPRNTNTEEHQHPSIHRLIPIVVGPSVSPNTDKLPKFAPALLSTLAALAALAALATTYFPSRPSFTSSPWPSLPLLPSLPSLP